MLHRVLIAAAFVTGHLLEKKKLVSPRISPADQLSLRYTGDTYVATKEQKLSSINRAQHNVSSLFLVDAQLPSVEDILSFELCSAAGPFFLITGDTSAEPKKCLLWTQKSVSPKSMFKTCWRNTRIRTKSINCVCFAALQHFERLTATPIEPNINYHLSSCLPI